MSASDSLFLLVVLRYPVGVVHLVVKLLLSVLASVHSTEVIRTPHLVGVELVGASKLVLVRLAVHTVEEGVAGFKAHLLVPHHLLGVSHCE